MGLMFLLVLWQWRLLRGKSFHTVTGKGYTPRMTDLGPWRWATFALLRALLRHRVVLPVGQLHARLVLPVLRLLPVGHADAGALPRGVANSEVWRAFGNTLLLGLVGAIGHDAARRHRRLYLGADPWRGPAADRRAGLAAMDDAGNGAGVGFLWAFALLPGDLRSTAPSGRCCSPTSRWARRWRCG